MAEHISQQFNAELENVRNQVENHVQSSVTALVEGDEALAERIVDDDFKVNALEVSVDEQCTQIIARRQPTAGDLRLVMMIVKTITDLERIGDEAEKVAKMAKALVKMEISKGQYGEIRVNMYAKCYVILWMPLPVWMLKQLSRQLLKTRKSIPNMKPSCVS